MFNRKQRKCVLYDLQCIYVYLAQPCLGVSIIRCGSVSPERCLFIRSFVRSFVCSLIHSLLHSLARSLNHSLTHFMHFLFTSRVYYLETLQVGKHHRQFLDFFFFSRKFSRHGVKFFIHAQFNLIQNHYCVSINLCFQLISLLFINFHSKIVFASRHVFTPYSSSTSFKFDTR